MNRQDPRTIARVFGWLFVATFVTSIPAYFILYAPVRDDPGLITGTGADPTASVALGAALEVFLIIANVGTAVVVYPILKRQSEIGAVGYVGARLVECIFIAIGIISLLTFLFMRQEGTADAAVGETLVAIYDRAFLVGPGFFAGLANGVILGYLMYRSGLVPRGMAMLGLIGGPLVMASGIAIMFDVTERGSTLQGIATIPEFFWSSRSASTASSRASGLHPSSPWMRQSPSRRALRAKGSRASSPVFPCGSDLPGVRSLGVQRFVALPQWGQFGSSSKRFDPLYPDERRVAPARAKAEKSPSLIVRGRSGGRVAQLLREHSASTEYLQVPAASV
jgi:hypothetical protein